MTTQLRWQGTGDLTGWHSRIALTAVVLVCIVWVGWPIWGSGSAPGPADRDAETPLVLAAVLALLATLTVAMWADARRHMSAFGPVVLLSMADVLIRLTVDPATPGLEFVYAIPLLTGAVLGAPAGFLTGALSCLASSAALGQISWPIIGQLLVWGLWGIAGATLRRLRTWLAWLAAVVISLPLGVISGAILNLPGWSTEAGSHFLPGLAPLDSFQRLWAYSVETSLAVDLTRGVMTALVTAVVGLPLLRALRLAWAPHHSPVRAEPPRPQISAAALARRQRSQTLTRLWQGEE